MKVSSLEWTILLLSINTISTYPVKNVFENRKKLSEYPFSKFRPTFDLRGFEERNPKIGYISRNERSNRNETEPEGVWHLPDHNKRQNYRHRLGSKIDIDLDKKIVHMHLGEGKKAVRVSRFVEETGMVVDVPKEVSTNGISSLGDESNKKRSAIYSLDSQTTDKDGLQNISKKIIKTLLVVRNNLRETDNDISTSTVTAIEKQIKTLLTLTTPLLPLIDIIKIATNMSTNNNTTDVSEKRHPSNQNDNDTLTTIEPDDISSGKRRNNTVKCVKKPILKRKFILETPKSGAQSVTGLGMAKDDYNSVKKKIEALIRHHKHNGKLVSKIRLGIGKNGEIVKAMRLDITNKCVRKVQSTGTLLVPTRDFTPVNGQLAASTKENATESIVSENELKGNKVLCTAKPCDCGETTSTTTAATSTKSNSNKSSEVRFTRGLYNADESLTRTCPYCRSFLGTTKKESFVGPKFAKSEQDPTTPSSDEERLNSIFYEIWNPLPNFWNKDRLVHIPSAVSTTPAPITCVPSPNPEILTTEKKKKTVLYLEGDYGDEYEENVVFVPQTLNCKQLFDICKLCKDEVYSTTDSGKHSTKTSGLVTAPRRKLIFRKDKVNNYKTLMKHNYEKNNQNVHVKTDRDDQTNSITFNIEIKIPAEELRHLEKNEDKFTDNKVKCKRMNNRFEGKRKLYKIQDSGANMERRKDKWDEDELVGIDMGTDDAITAEDIEKEHSRPFIKVRRLDKHSNRQTKHDQDVLRSETESPLMRMLAANMRKYKKKVNVDESTESRQEGEEVTEEEPADSEIDTEAGDLNLVKQLAKNVNRNKAHGLCKPSTTSPTTNIVVFYIIDEQLVGTEKYQEPYYSE